MKFPPRTIAPGCFKSSPPKLLRRLRIRVDGDPVLAYFTAGLLPDWQPNELQVFPVRVSRRSCLTALLMTGANGTDQHQGGAQDSCRTVLHQISKRSKGLRRAGQERRLQTFSGNPPPWLWRLCKPVHILSCGRRATASGASPRIFPRLRQRFTTQNGIKRSGVTKIA